MIQYVCTVSVDDEVGGKDEGDGDDDDDDDVRGVVITGQQQNMFTILARHIGMSWPLLLLLRPFACAYLCVWVCVVCVLCVCCVCVVCVCVYVWYVCVLLSCLSLAVSISLYTCDARSTVTAKLTHTP